jgi:hypothetical protein
MRLLFILFVVCSVLGYITFDVVVQTQDYTNRIRISTGQ